MKQTFTNSHRQHTISESGELRFLKEVKSPWQARLTVEKFDRNEWNVLGLDRKVFDLCLDLQSPSNPLYTFFKQFKKKSCPFPAGHIEKFENGEVTQIPSSVPASYEGRFRILLRFEYRTVKGLQVDCTNVNFDLVDAS